MNGAYYLFSMIMSVIIYYYLTVRNNHYYLMGAYIIHVSLHQYNCKSLKGLAPECITNMFSLKTHSINLRTSGTHSLVIPVSILLDMAFTLYLTMEVNYGTPSLTPLGHCQQLQLSNRLFVILTAVLSVNSCQLFDTTASITELYIL